MEDDGANGRGSIRPNYSYDENGKEVALDGVSLNGYEEKRLKDSPVIDLLRDMTADQKEEVEITTLKNDGAAVDPGNWWEKQMKDHGNERKIQILNILANRHTDLGLSQGFWLMLAQHLSSEEPELFATSAAALLRSQALLSEDRITPLEIRAKDAIRSVEMYRNQMGNRVNSAAQ